MATITAYTTASGKRYRVRYRKPDRSQTDKRGFKTKRDAELYLAGIEVSKSRGAYVDPSKTRVTVSQWMEVWLASRNDMRATTRTRVEGIIGTHINSQLGGTPLGDLTRLRTQQWASQLPGAPETVRKVVNVLSGALQFAIEDGRLAANPASRLKLPKKTKTAKRYLTHDQVAALAQAVGERSNGSALGYDILVLLLAYCGLRWGELCGLRVRDVDLKRGRLSVEQTVVADKGYQRVEPPKDYEHRSIPIPLFLLPHLQKQVAGRADDAPVFYGQRTGTHLRNHVFRIGWFDDAAAAVGLVGLTPHELRHTAASLAVSAGANVKAVQRMLGHAHASVTLDVYADLFDEDLDSVAVALDHAALNSNVGKMWADDPKPALKALN
ncbi:tyrosine-type recombinase/integrase [Salinibacterium sp. ZJ450]|uniref:tyrosine-type recombinase/integrase n=1 Tax=Salinibacterium sp. ZJ450 TaxID=2708338 RepID=UPI001423B61D|nr:tyrosine-type recombinase/integrase [Salinibacterium sp. ZJ450]